MHHIAIVVHERGDFDRSRYFLHAMSQLWAEQGFRISVHHGPPAADADRANIAILHVDLTLVPQPYLEFVRAHPVAVNVGVADISKRRISQQMVHRGDGYNGPVIVKTNRNSGGLREAMLAARRSRLRRFTARLRNRLPWSCRSELPTDRYPIFPSPQHVPWPVWHNPHLVVEQFLAERQDDLYCLRTWVFFGDRETNSLSLSREPIVKAHNIVRRQVIDEVPPELRRIRSQLNFQFGKFDYAIVDGQPVLYDANRTPTLPPAAGDALMPRIRHLAEGIGSFL